MFKRSLVALAVSAASLLAARAADLPVKAVAYAPAATCTYTNCTGLFLGLTATEIGSQDVNVLGLGAVNANGLYMGAQGGYQLLNGSYMLAAKARVEYEVFQSANDALAGSAFKDKLFAFEGMEIGGNLAQLFPGVAVGVQLPAWLTPLVTGVEIGGCQHGSKLSGYCIGAAAHYYLPATQWSFDADVLNAQYGSTVVGTGMTTSVETRASAGITYHFGGFGSR